MHCFRGLHEKMYHLRYISPDIYKPRIAALKWPASHCSFGHRSRTASARSSVQISTTAHRSVAQQVFQYTTPYTRIDHALSHVRLRVVAASWVFSTSHIRRDSIDSSSNGSACRASILGQLSKLVLLWCHATVGPLPPSRKVNQATHFHAANALVALQGPTLWPQIDWKDLG